MQEVFLERRKGHLDENLNALFLISVTLYSANAEKHLDF